MAEKTKAERLTEQLFYKNETAWNQKDDDNAMAFAADYKKFLDCAKIEREAIDFIIGESEVNGFSSFDENKEYKKGDKVYINNRGKALALIKFGEKDLSEGLRIVAAHIDSPRLDLKPNPLYEEESLCYLKTHYYGGIRKYQWPSIPLALHGVIVKKGGDKITVSIGETEDDPCFAVNDLLPHLATEQSKKTLSDAFPGESLNVLVGNIPFKGDKVSSAVKLNIMNILFGKYGIIERDFLSAELSVVPAFKAKDIGFDRSMIGSYGQDDRVCAYTAYKAIFDSDIPTHTTLVVLADKEEVGSEGNTGLASDFLHNIVSKISFKSKTPLHTIFEKSKCLSADVSCGYDPNFANVYEKRNSAFLGNGVVVMKYTGSRGKSDTSDATAEYMGFIRDMLEENEISWQAGELGAVDIGGGGTVAKYIANLLVDTVDVGVPVLAMHSPFEITSKIDIYMAYRTFRQFIK